MARNGDTVTGGWRSPPSVGRGTTLQALDRPRRVLKRWMPTSCSTRPPGQAPPEDGGWPVNGQIPVEKQQKNRTAIFSAAPDLPADRRARLAVSPGLSLLAPVPGHRGVAAGPPAPRRRWRHRCQALDSRRSTPIVKERTGN